MLWVGLRGGLGALSSQPATPSRTLRFPSVPCLRLFPELWASRLGWGKARKAASGPGECFALASVFEAVVRSQDTDTLSLPRKYTRLQGSQGFGLLETVSSGCEE